MSRRARTRLNKRDEAARIHTLFAEGFSLTESDVLDDTPDEADDWDGHGEDPHGRTPIGPVNVAPASNGSHAG